MNSNLYLELLDGEYLKIASSQHALGQEAVYRAAERYLKIMALFGYQATLSDIQIVDSGLWLDLWSQPSFAVFLREHERFAEVRAGDSGSSQYQRVISGLERTQNGGWISSGFNETDRIKRFAESILIRGEAIQEIDLVTGKGIPDDLSSLIRDSQNGADKRRLKSVLRSMQHFLKNPSVVTRRQGTNYDYYTVLGEFARGSGTFGNLVEDAADKQAFVARVLERIDSCTNDTEARKKRSILLAKLDTTSWPQLDREMWYTVVHAWNCAIRNSLGVEGMVLGSLSEGINLGLFMDPIEKLFYPPIKGDEDMSEVLRRSHMPVVELRRDPQDFNWAEIIGILDATTSSRKKLIESRHIDSSTHEMALKEHIELLSQHIAGPKPLSGIPGQILTIAGVVALCWGVHVPQEIANTRTLIGGSLLLPNYIHSLKGRWIASGLRKAYGEFNKAEAVTAIPSKRNEDKE